MERGLVLENMKCGIYESELETGNNLLFSCEETNNNWRIISDLAGITEEQCFRWLFLSAIPTL